ncbi:MULTISPECIES: hypothetical protein [Alicyclobacillus]|uniref:Uncharacterized protein n=1 Tax=Alicyclobacillus acidoterrestris (strain ATCC 49025 / DSM 3922 / CIP 106132 / NCIMB 13137 / GD3B) TaxID=1356854 RepID=T0DE42_ALIAG|nr:MULTISPECIES: hypothetical protein [Alicyclobacillus]EPZ47891.1 hypothetical protein N007_04850 [Alicyclobacillus acidoterrestris ATCC 49025]UNO51041.1 hypothetical protein K1I37_20915 [Alicyclobacillus acidoterrestris]GEO27753.1 hypothetical protein AAC03nite_35380 [Alicyclobacillus acidoterrestris]
MTENTSERTAEEEARILRRVVRRENRKQLKKGETIRVEGRLNGIRQSGIVTLTLLEIPQPDSMFAEDISELTNLALRHAHERCERLRYKKVLGVHFDGKVWSAKLEF